MRANDGQADGRAAAPLLTVRLLGGFTVHRADVGPLTAPWRRPSAQVVVKLLALAPSHRMSRQEVMDVCWPDASAASARSRLRVALHAVRHAFEPDLRPGDTSAYLASSGDLLVLDPHTVGVDLDAVEAEAGAAIASADVDLLTAAADSLSSADLLPEDRWVDWTEPRRRELARLRRRVVLALAAASLASGAPHRAVDPLERLVGEDECDEEVTRALASAYVGAGRTRKAVERYQRMAALLREELGTTPSAESERLFATILPSEARRSTPSGSDRPTLPAILRRRPSAPLRGRERLLADLLARMPGAPAEDEPEERGATPLTIVSGESGVGKSRLVADVARALASRGVTVLWGAAHEAEGRLPYGPIVDAIEGWSAGLDPAARHRLLAAHPHVASILPGSEAAGGRGGDHGERVHLFRDVGELLAGVGDEVVVVLDDLHAADLGTLQLVHHLVRTARGPGVHFLASFRDDAASDDLAARRPLLAALARQGLSHRVELMRLTREACDALVLDVARAHRGQHPEPLRRADLARVFELSGGNPLLAGEITHALCERHEAGVDLTATPDAALPDSVRDLVTDRLARTSGPTRSLLGVLSAANGAVSVREVTDAARDGLRPPLVEPDLSDELDRLVTDRLVDECEIVLGGAPAPGLTFRHPVIGLAVYDGLTQARRRRLHAALGAAALRHRPGSVDTIAQHLDLADDPEAAPWLARAARRAASVYADDTADRHFAALARRLAIDGRPAEELAAVQVDWAEVMTRRGRYEDAEGALRSALDALPADDPGAHRATAVLASVLGRAGHPGEGIALVDAVDADRMNPADAVACALARGELCFVVGRHDEVVHAAERAMVLSRELPDEAGTRGRGRAEHLRSVSLLLSGDHDGALRAANEALDAAQRVGDLSLQSKALSVLRELATLEGRLEVALGYSRRTHAVAERLGDPLGLAFERANLALLQLALGDPDRARRSAASALSTARPYGRTWCLPYVLLCLGEVELHAGDDRALGSAQHLVTEAAGHAEQLGDQQAASSAALLLAELDVVRGDPETALTRLDGPDGGGDTSAAARALRADALLGVSEPQPALASARQALDAALTASDRPRETEARRVLALALAAGGESQEAARHLAEALRAARAMGHVALERRIETARLQVRDLANRPETAR